MNLLGLFLFVKVPIASKATGPPVGTLPGAMVVLLAVARGVNVGVIVLVNVGFGVFLGVAFDAVGVAVSVAVNVGEGGLPVEITIASSEKPGALVGVGPPLPLPPPQLRRIAPRTNNTTGVTTSHLSHRDNIKS